jgi:hypothetical protein
MGTRNDESFRIILQSLMSFNEVHKEVCIGSTYSQAAAQDLIFLANSQCQLPSFAILAKATKLQNSQKY